MTGAFSRRRFLALAGRVAGTAVGAAGLAGVAAACSGSSPGPVPSRTPGPSSAAGISVPVAVFTSPEGGQIFNGGVAVLPSRRWLMVYQYRPPNTSQSLVMGRYSSDEGRTYGEAFVLSEAPSPLIDPYPLLTPSGRLLVQYQTRYQTGGEGGWIRQVVSTDEGATWTSPADATVVAGRGTAADQANESVLHLLADGTILCLFAAFSQTPAGERLDTTISAIRSSDDGATWSAPVLVHDLGTERFQVRSVGLQLPDGRVQCYYNTWEDDPAAMIRKIAVASSSDGGLSWSPGAVGGSSSNVVAAVPGVDLIAPWPIRHQDGTIQVAFVAAVSSPSPGRQVWVASSSDDGRTWSAPTVANGVTHGVGRPVIVPASDGHVMYENGLVPVDRTQVLYQLMPA